MWFNTTSPSREREKLINQYIDLETNLRELILDLVAQKPTPGNLLLIETALEGKFSTSNTVASDPKAELINQLQALNYPQLAIKASTGAYDHTKAPKHIRIEEVSFTGSKIGPR